MIIIISYLAFISWILGMIILFVSMQYETVLQKYKVYPKGVKLRLRPWGFKRKELVELLENTENYELKIKLKKALKLRKLGYLLLLMTPVFLLLNSLFIR